MGNEQKTSYSYVVSLNNYIIDCNNEDDNIGMINSIKSNVNTPSFFIDIMVSKKNGSVAIRPRFLFI